jgi:hypothetical protein
MARTAEYPVVISAEILETKKSPASFNTYLKMLSQLLVQRLMQEKKYCQRQVRDDVRGNYGNPC